MNLLRVLASCVAALSADTAIRFSPPVGGATAAASMDAAAMSAAPAAALALPSSVVTTPSGIIIEPLPAPAVSITLRNINSDEMETFAIVPDGHVDAATAGALKHFLRCRRTHREKPIAAGTLALLASVAQRWPGHVIEIVSGFRAPPYGKPHSKHFVGYAIDLRVEGVKTSTVRDTVWREHHEVGVGHYTDENFVHMDYRPGETDRAWSSRSESDDLDYNPRWAYQARHPQKRHTRHSDSPRS